MSRRRFSFAKKRGWWFDVSPDGIHFHRPYRANSVRFTDPREAAITTFRQARDVFDWHWRHGLAHRRPHPLGLNLYELECVRVAQLHADGQMWAKAIPFEDWMAESARMCARDGKRLMPDGAMAD